MADWPAAENSPDLRRCEIGSRSFPVAAPARASAGVYPIRRFSLQLWPSLFSCDFRLTFISSYHSEDSLNDPEIPSNFLFFLNAFSKAFDILVREQNARCNKNSQPPGQTCDLS